MNIKSRTSSNYSAKPDGVLLLALLLAVVPLTIGCGPSKQELMMRQAQRSRSDDDPAPAKQPEKPAEEPQPEIEKPKEEPKEPEVKVEQMVTAAGKEIELKEYKPISERKPEQPLSDEERRKRAYDNLVAVSDALLTYMRDRGRLPKRFKEANGYKTLSWRVEILPFLGYEDLYNKFDPTVPWNRPPNDELLQFIPDEYVSPERFDDQTNIVMPSRRGFIGGDGGQLSPNDVEDGMPNTLLLVEVNDSGAVPWTAPEDFEPRMQAAAKKAMLGLRKDGSFAVWGNGWPVLIANELPDQVFWDALTASAGDGLVAGRVHRDIPIKKVTDAAVAAADQPESPDVVPSPIAQAQGPTPAMPDQIIDIRRDDVPSPAELAESQRKLRELYADKIRDANKDDKDKLKLAGEMLKQAERIQDNPSDAYALQSAAMRLASDGAGIQELLDAIDQRVGRFEVDAYDENMKALLEFGNSVMSRDTEKIRGMDFVKRSVKVIFAAIHDDDYVRAIALNRHAYRMAGQKRDEDVPKKLNRLRSLLGTAKRQYDEASDALADFRIDPKNGEAASLVGRYLCFIKGDYRQGLPLLTRGGPEALREMAAMDIKGAEDYMNKVAIGDAWWDMAEKARSNLYHQAARDRAVLWYSEAYGFMPDSLDKLHVKNRLDDAKGIDASSPLALVERLAKDLQIDLAVGLAAIADVGQNNSQQPYGAARSNRDYDADG